uniref:Uncharacterized protein n=1 Tax=Romanomermis culicivorax TaxID=13658 RepID=A0A915I0V0_ROMCU
MIECKLMFHLVEILLILVQIDYIVATIAINLKITTTNFEEESEDLPAATDEPYKMEISAFKCPEEGCTLSAAFVLYRNLLEHITLGNHKLMPQQSSLHDMAMQSYSRILESVRLTPGLPEVQEALQLFYEADSFDVMEKGWASNKHKICRPVTEKQCQYLLEKYNSGSPSYKTDNCFSDKISPDHEL